MWFEVRKRNPFLKYWNNPPELLVFVPLLLFFPELAGIAVCLREAFRTSGNVSFLYVWVLVLVFLLAVFGVTVACLSLARKKQQRKAALPMAGILLNCLSLFGILGIYAIGM